MTSQESSTRLMPRIPAPGERVPVLIDTDTGCEIDDQYAIALAMLMPERFDIKGYVATFFRGSPDSIPEAVAEIDLVVERCGLAGKFPIVPGGHPIQYPTVGNGSKGAEFIIETAKQHSPENPLWVVVLGPTTNIASAIIQCPEITRNMVVLFHGRTQYWPKQAWNNNVDADLRATQVLFASDVPLVLFDTGTFVRIDNETTLKRVAPRGRIGAYLQDMRQAKPEPRATIKKGFFDLGDIAWLADPTLGPCEEIDVPTIARDTFLDWGKTHGRALRVFQLDDRGVWECLFKALEKQYPEETPYEPHPEVVTLYPETARARAEEARKAAGPRPERVVPRLPEPGVKIPLLIDTDCGTEIDDQYGIAMALAAPDRFDLKGFAGDYFHGEPDSPQKVKEEIERLLDLAGMPGKWPIKVGCPPLSWPNLPTEGESVDFIIEQVMAHTAEDPLWIVALGPLSNVASAYLREPGIAERMVLLFHARCQHWPLKFSSYNGVQDLRATQVVLRSDIPLILFDGGTYLCMPMEETEKRLAPSGKLGAYLHEYRLRKPWYQREDKGFYDLADLAWLYDLSLGEWQEVNVPNVDTDLYIKPTKANGRCLHVHQVDNRRMSGLFYEKMAEAFGK